MRIMPTKKVRPAPGESRSRNPGHGDGGKETTGIAVSFDQPGDMRSFALRHG
jgi:hypothetical protein